MDYQITLGDIETGSNLISPLSSALGRLIFMAKGFKRSLKLFKWLSDSRASEREKLRWTFPPFSVRRCARWVKSEIDSGD